VRCLSISDSNSVYSCSKRLQLNRRSVEYPEFEEFSFALRAFEQSLREAHEDDYWRQFLWPLRAYGFGLLAAPLLSGHPSACPPDTAGALRKHLAKCDLIYPGLAAPARGLVDRMTSLSQPNSSPLLDVVWELACEAVEEGRTAVLLVKNQRLAAASEMVLESEPDLGSVKVAVPAQMRGGDCYGRIIATGSDRWFPEHVFSAPRAQEVWLVHYSWISNDLKLEPLLRGSTREVRDWTAGGAPGKLDLRERLPAEQLVPTLDWGKALARARRRASAGPASEEVEARLSLLEGKWAVFLDANEGATIQAIDLEEEQALQLKRVSVSHIEPGMFIILRTEGGGDYVVPLADRILGEAAGRLRNLQTEWKQLLRTAVQLRGLSAAAAQLRRYRARLANEQNLRNWMSPRSIKPYYYEDFAAVMRLAGIGDRAEEYWRAMSVILKAHMKAGFHIRKLLLREILASDLEELEMRGRKDFNLTEAAGAVLTAFRVEGISEETVMVSPSRIGVPFELENSLWQ
jgi:hypothetical protein